MMNAKYLLKFKTEIIKYSCIKRTKLVPSFHICTDASDIAVWEVLGQRGNQMPYAIYFVSKNLSIEEFNYTVTEKELLVVVHDIHNLDTILQDMKILYTLIIQPENS
jgi:hypothetical protein